MTNYFKTGEAQKDLAAKILENIGDLEGIKLIGNSVLVGIYVRPEKTAGGLYITDTTRQEDEYQGKVGLVLKVGPRAYDREWQKLYGENVPKVGDWITFKVYDTWMTKINGTLCRMLKDTETRAIVDHPEMVY